MTEVRTSVTCGVTTFGSLDVKKPSQGKSRRKELIFSRWAFLGNQSRRVVEGRGGVEEKEQETEITLWSEEPRGADIE